MTVSGKPEQHVKIYRAGSWPTGAPGLSEVRATGKQLFRAIHAALQEPCSYTVDRLIINANQRISIRMKEKARGSVHVRIHWLLIHEERIPQAIAQALSGGSFPPGMRDTIDQIRQQADPSQFYPRRAKKLNSQGKWIHLDRVLESVARYLPEDVDLNPVSITWGRHGYSKRSIQRGIKLGSLAPGDLIRIHPVLDNPWVPTHVMEFVVFHELCHFVAPPLTSKEARRRRDNRVHHRKFRRLERCYPNLQMAEEWLDVNLHKLLVQAGESP